VRLFGLLTVLPASFFLILLKRRWRRRTTREE
jgi:membrane protein implicated in regulation of membrane protease activity